MQLDEPNMALPLASSYNVRGVDGFTNVVTNANDQRKINVIYEPVKNALTGNTTLYVSKRPGAVLRSETYGTSGQTAYLLQTKPGASFNLNGWLFSTSGNDIRASDESTTTTVVTAAGYVPTFADKTVISGTDTLVLQIRNSSEDYRFFFSSDIATFTEISDGDFTGLTHRGKMEFMDGYAFIIDVPTKRIYNSDLNSLANWSASSYITKQIKQEPAAGLAKFGNQLLAFGAGTFEVFRNAGNPTGSPLEPVKSMAQNYGLAWSSVNGVGRYYHIIGGELYFTGRSADGSRNVGIFAYNGQSVSKVSTAFIDKILNSLLFDATENIFSLDRISFYGKTALTIALTSPSATTQRWLMFFPEWNDWFEWNSTVFKPVGNGALHLGVDSNQHRVYTMYNVDTPADSWQDNGTNYDAILQFRLPSKGNSRKFMRWCGFDGTQERTAATIGVQFSDDDGQNWSSSRTIDRTSDKQHLYRCGSYRNRMVRLTNGSNHEGRLEKFLARVD